MQPEISIWEIKGHLDERLYYVYLFFVEDRREFVLKYGLRRGSRSLLASYDV